jgi:L-methionine (R)-S-oxide reductase
VPERLLALPLEGCILIVPRGGFSLIFSEIEPQIEAILSRPLGARERLQSLCDLLKVRVSHYDWFGFYIARRTEALLDLGPFAGEPTEHVLIPFGLGICGQAAAKGETFLVDDVSAASNYLACSLKVKSEIVVPVFAPGGADVAGEIDIDSHAVAAFGPEDRAFLEKLALRVAADIAELRR